MRSRGTFPRALPWTGLWTDRWPSAEDDGIDILLEFTDEEGNGIGKGLCLRLKVGNSHLTKRKTDGAEIFTGSIADNLTGTAQIAAHQDRSKFKIAEHKQQATAIKEQCGGVRAKMKKLYDLYIAGGIGVEQFKEHTTRLHDRLGQRTEELPKLEGKTPRPSQGSSR